MRALGVVIIEGKLFYRSIDFAIYLRALCELAQWKRERGVHTCPEPKTSDCHRQLQKRKERQRERRVREREKEEAGKFVRGRIFNSIYSQ